MGRKNKAYFKDLKTQIFEKLTDMLHSGENTSKKEAIRTGTDRDKIFSYNTYQTYWKHCKYFAEYIQREHPDCTTLKSAKKYVNEWLQARADQVDENGNYLSAWTIQTEAKALGKLYGIQPDDPKYFVAPQRRRSEIKRSRGDVARDRHFSEKNNDELIKFCRGTGLRRRELQELRGKDLVTREQIETQIRNLKSKNNRTEWEKKQLNMLLDTRLFQGEYFTYIRNGKGGRERVSPIIGSHTEQIVNRIKNTPKDDKVWQHVNSYADIHGYRGDYATEIYRAHARKIEDIPYDKVSRSGKKYQGDLYVCRKDKAGKKLDRAAMLVASKALGHNRIEVVANNYIRGL